MIRTETRFDQSALGAIERKLDRQLRAAALQETHNAARGAVEDMRQQMSAAGLGRLGFALGSGSDKQKSGTVFALPGGRWSASGWVFIRSQSQRTIGAIKSYTEGAEILPRRGRYLWFPTDDVKRLVGLPIPTTGGGRGTANYRLEPRYWDRTYGRKFGPLQQIRGADGTPLLVVRNATVSLSGKRGSLRPLTKTGRVPKGQVQQDTIVAFIGIPRTSRAARINPRTIAAARAAAMTQKLGPAFSGSISE